MAGANRKNEQVSHEDRPVELHSTLPATDLRANVLESVLAFGHSSWHHLPVLRRRCREIGSECSVTLTVLLGFCASVRKQPRLQPVANRLELPWHFRRDACWRQLGSDMAKKLYKAMILRTSTLCER